jgi:hypothetical protein
MRTIEQTDKSLQRSLWCFFWIQVSFSTFLVASVLGPDVWRHRMR